MALFLGLIQETLTRRGKLSTLPGVGRSGGDSSEVVSITHEMRDASRAQCRLAKSTWDDVACITVPILPCQALDFLGDSNQTF